MSENQERIDELMKKLELLIQQQAAFSQDVNSLKEEILGLKSEPVEPAEPEFVQEEPVHTPEPEPIPEPVSEPVPEPIEVVWPDHVDLKQITKDLTAYEEDVTKGGKKFIKFMVSRHNVAYDVSCAENGNWIVQSKQKDLIAKGRFMEDGKTVAVTKGENEGLVLSRSNLTACIAEAAGLNKPLPIMEREATAPEAKEEKHVAPTPAAKPQPVAVQQPREKSGVEKFVGENLIAVIAICIILIGVVFGVKYSIDHNLISPLMRVVLSYLLGAGILSVGIWLKKKYEMFSAILVSGSMAIMYFVTFAAYSFYGLIPQLPTFGVMVLFTAFTAYTAIHYNRQIIAHIALVGSYAVPFLLSDGSGNVKALFIYMTIVNAGILFIAMKKHWKPLYYVAFGCTWLIYLGWYLGAYNSGSEHFTIGLVFGAIFFLLFYATFLVYKLIKKEQFAQEDIVMILLNSTVYYGTSYMMLEGHYTGQDYLGLFTIATAVVHFVVSVILYNSKLADRKLFYLSSGMVLVFLTIAIPVQLDGTWVTLLWGTEAALLFWIGRTKNVKIYEFLSYPVMAIALFSLGHDWLEAYEFGYNPEKLHAPFANVTFLTTAIIAASFGAIVYVNNMKKHAERFGEANPSLLQFLKAAFTIILIFIVYNMFRLEMNVYWYQQYLATLIEVEPEHMFDWSNELYNKDLLHFKDIWTIIYSMVFVIGLSFLNMKKLKSQSFGITNILANIFVLFIFMTVGLYKLSLLRESYIAQPYADVYEYSSMAIGIRYISIAAVGAMLYTLYRYIRESYIKLDFRLVFELLMHGTILWVLCSELINVLDLTGSHEQHKLGLSILCGLYAFVLVGIGIWRGRQYLRIAAFVLFGLTMVKVFFYDIAHLTTIAKTIAFISLGLILLLISFMYNKYKDKIQHEED